MNAEKSILVLVTVCILAPIMLGYAWPTSDEEVDQYEIGGGTDITSAVSTDMVPIFTSYTGAFNNSFFTIAGYINGNRTVDSTVPHWVDSDATGNIPIYMSSTTDSTIQLSQNGVLDIGSMTFEEGVVRVSLDFDPGFEISGHGRADTLIYFPNTEQVVFNDSISRNAGTVSSDVTITASAAGTVERRDYKPNPDSYANLDAGFWVPTASTQWYNGFLNRSVEMLIHPNSYASGWEMFILTWEWSLRLRIVNDVISVSYGQDTTAWTELGGVEAYPNVRVTLDAADGLITVEGLVGMNTSAGGFGFLAPQTPGRSLEFETSRTEGFTRLTMECTTGYGAAFLVTETESQIGTRPGLVNDIMQGDAFYPDGNWQLFIGDTSVFGDSITIGSTAFPVSRTGEITVSLVDGGTETIQVRDIAIMSVSDGNTRHWFIDGEEISASFGRSVTFGGTWMCDLVIFDMDIVPKTIYFWEMGGFGLDMQGFCMAGLMADILAFVALALYGKGMGKRILPLLIACTVIAAFFIMMLMQTI